MDDDDDGKGSRGAPGCGACGAHLVAMLDHELDITLVGVRLRDQRLQQGEQLLLVDRSRFVSIVLVEHLVNVFLPEGARARRRWRGATGVAEGRFAAACSAPAP